MSTPPPTPILLLKSPSPNPTTDPYTTHLTQSPSQPYTPHYIPVLTHTLLPDPIINLLLEYLQCPTTAIFPYGAIIFTSQRAVAAFTTAINAPPIQNRLQKLRELQIDFYTVGPATERALRGVRDRLLPLCRMVGGEEAGSGEVLAGMMLGREGMDGERKYRTRTKEGGVKQVLFVTGEKKRDVIPRMLMDPALKEDVVPVVEMVVYETAELEEFEFGFGKALQETGEDSGMRWVVVFSPTAGRGMLKALGWLDEVSGKVKDNWRDRKTFVVCIGPTTREYLHLEFGFKADVVAEKPSPQGVRDGIEHFLRERRT